MPVSDHIIDYRTDPPTDNGPITVEVQATVDVTEALPVRSIVAASCAGASAHPENATPLTRQGAHMICALTAPNADSLYVQMPSSPSLGDVWEFYLLHSSPTQACFALLPSGHNAGVGSGHNKLGITDMGARIVYLGDSEWGHL